MGRASTGGSRCRRSIRLGQEAIAFGNEVLDFLEQEAMPGLGTTDQLGVRRLLREDIGWFRRSHASIGRRSSPRSQGGSTVQSRRLILQTCLASCGGGLRHRDNGAFALLRGQFDTRLHRLAAGPASHLLRGCPFLQALTTRPATGGPHQGHAPAQPAAGGCHDRRPACPEAGPSLPFPVSPVEPSGR